MVLLIPKLIIECEKVREYGQEAISEGEDHNLRSSWIVIVSVAKVLADAAKTNVHTYTRRRRAVSTGSGGISTAEESVSTAGASMSVSTASMVQEVNISIPSPVVIKDKGKAAVRLQEELDEEERQRMARVHEAAQSFTEEEWENIRVMSETIQRKENTDDLVMLWNLVKERFSLIEPTDDKERTLWVELKRLFEPNTDDTLWKLQRYIHDLLKWRLYDTCGVHHVSTERGIDIFMLVEKEYP
ncbi:hypothetical protein Tco_1263573 [Tanacetum coccineum]